MNLESILMDIYSILLRKFGFQKWWPVKSKVKAERQLEIAIGAILTQNTAWKNVEKALENLRHENLLNEKALQKVKQEKLASLIKPSGYYNQKAKKLKAFISFLKDYDFEKLENMPTEKARALLLNIHGIGKETADSILLYALNMPVFVIDAYTKRIFERMLNLKFNSYEQLQEFFHANLPHEARLFNEYHALLVKHGKEFCKKKPLCEKCPIERCDYRNKLNFISPELK